MTSTSSTQQISRPKRGRKPKNSSPEQPESEILQIQEKTTQDTINQETTTQETTTAVIGQPPPNAAMTSISSTQQIPRPKRGRKSKNSSTEQPIGTESTESETLQIQETATQDTTTQDADAAMTSTSSTQQIPRPKRGRKPKNSSLEETTTAVIEQSPPDATSTSSTQQIPRPKRGRKPKNSSPEQLVGTESEILQTQETATQDTTTQETTTTVIEQPPSGVAIASTSSTQQIPRPKRGRKSKNSSSEQPIGTESETLQIQETVIQETTIAVIEQPSLMTSTSSAQQISQMPLPKRGRKPKETTAQITEEPTNVASTSATTSQRGRKRKIVAESSTTANQMASNNPDEEISEGNPPKRGRINVSKQELAEPVEVPSTTTAATKIRGKRRKPITENDDGEQEADLAKENKRSKMTKKPEEKRLFNTRKNCTAATYERIVRAEQQRLYMVSRTKVDDLREEFAVLGSTGNVYTVTIAHVPNCTCPDFNKGNLCKHIIFVYLRVLRLNRDSSFIYQKALLSTELRSIFAKAAPDPTVSVLANQRVRDKYKTFTSGEPESNADENEKRRPIEGDCPICYELLEEKDHKNIVWCKEGCGNNLHKECFEQWKRSKRGDKVTCVYCRTNWVDPDSKISINEEGYVNLGDIQGMITVRDTTSYYRKYRRTWF